MRFAVEHINVKNEDPSAEYLSLMANKGVLPYAEKGDVGNKAPEDLTRCKLVTRGDFVINSMNYQIGSYGRSDYSGVCSSVYIVLRSLKNRVDPRFIHRVLQIPAFQKHAQTFGNGILEHRKSISWDTLKNHPVPVPSLEVQRSIANYLDRETAETDAFIADQEELIELLSERRTATITRAVARGLDPNAPMKYSGVSWLGEVPNHWRIQRLWTLYDREKNVGYPEEQMLSVFRDYGVVPKNSRENLNKTAENRNIYQLVETGWLVCNRMKAWQGSVGISTYRGIVSGHYICFRPKHNESSRYLNYLFRSAPYIAGYRSISRGVRIGQAEIDNDDYRLLPVLLPTVAEQKAIIAYLDRETAEIDAAIADAREAIALSKERRAAVISAAVTGKIDVRDLVDPETSGVEGTSVGAA